MDTNKIFPNILKKLVISCACKKPNNSSTKTVAISTFINILVFSLTPSTLIKAVISVNIIKKKNNLIITVVAIVEKRIPIIDDIKISNKGILKKLATPNKTKLKGVNSPKTLSCTITKDKIINIIFLKFNVFFNPTIITDNFS